MREFSSDPRVCNRCGYCQSECPVYRETGLERTVARGRLDILKASQAMDLEMKTDPVLYDCTLCGSCREGCPLGVDVPGIIMRERERAADGGRAPFLIPGLMDGLLTRPRLMEYASAALRVYDAAGIRRVFRTLGLMGGQEGLLPAKIPPSFRSRRRAPRRETPGAYFLGCATNLFYPQVAEAVLAISNRMASVLEPAQNLCCGLPALVYGNRKLALELARRNVEILEGAERVVTDCATCASSLKAYGRWLEDDPDWAARARAVARRVRGISEYLLEVDAPPGEMASTASIHYPCHLTRHQECGESLDEALRQVKGLEIRPMEGAGDCCGGAGTYVVTHPRLAERIGSRKSDSVRQTGAEILVTECPACMSQLGRLMPRGSRVLHVAQVFAGAAGG